MEEEEEVGVGCNMPQGDELGNNVHYSTEEQVDNREVLPYTSQSCLLEPQPCILLLLLPNNMLSHDRYEKISKTVLPLSDVVLNHGMFVHAHDEKRKYRLVKHFKGIYPVVKKIALISAEHILPTRCTTFRLLQHFCYKTVDFQVHWTINVEMAYA